MTGPFYPDNYPHRLMILDQVRRRTPPPSRIPPPDPRGEALYGPSAHPAVLQALAHAFLGAAHAPQNAYNWFMDTEGRLNRFYAMQESLHDIAPQHGRTRVSSAWANDILYHPWQTRHYIHPRGG